MYYYCLGKWVEFDIYYTEYLELNNKSKIIYSLPEGWRIHKNIVKKKIYYSKKKRFSIGTITTYLEPLRPVEIIDLLTLEGYNLMVKMIKQDPNKRINAKESLLNIFLNDNENINCNTESVENNYSKNNIESIYNNYKLICEKNFLNIDLPITVQKEIENINIINQKKIKYNDEIYFMALQLFFKCFIKDKFTIFSKFKLYFNSCLFISHLFYEVSYYTLTEFLDIVDPKSSIKNYEIIILMILNSLEYKIILLPNYLFIYYLYSKIFNSNDNLILQSIKDIKCNDKKDILSELKNLLKLKISNNELKDYNLIELSHKCINEFLNIKL